MTNNNALKKLLINMLPLVVIISAFDAKARQKESTQQPQLLPPQVVSIQSGKNFTLAARLFRAPKAKGAVLVLPDCSSKTETYQELAAELQKLQQEVLVLDLRGYGESATDIFSHSNIKREAKDIVSYQQKMAILTAYWEEDALAAYQYLRESIGNKKPISMLTSGCTALYAISTAEKLRINKAVFITPKLDYSGKERYKNLIDIPTYFIDSIHHPDTYQVTNELFDWNGSRGSKLQLFKGDLYSKALLKNHPGLPLDIANWLAF